MKGYFGHIEKDTLENSDFRRVLFTGKHSQLVLMSLKPQEEIGLETHDHVDQFFRFEQGIGEVTIDDQKFEVHDGDSVIIPAGSKHNVVNTSQIEELKLYTIYSPANHPEGTVHHTKEEADLAEEEEHH